MSEAENRVNSKSSAAWLAGHMPAEEVALPAHLVKLPGTNWALWRWIGLRGAGFPASEVLKLAAPECADAADSLLEAEAGLADARKVAIAAVKDEVMQATVADRDALEKALRRLQKDKLPTGPVGSAPVASLIEVFRIAGERFEATRQSFKQSYQQAVLGVSQAIREVASTDRLQEAVIWQNRHAFHTGMASILRRSAAETTRGSKQRQHEELVANYLQRYCLKNDTIGFFGPVGWAQFVPDGEALVVRPGAELLAVRNVYFEVWGIDALGQSLAANEQLRGWIAPRRMSHVRLEGHTLCMPSKPPVNLSVSQAAILQACDGNHTPKQIAAQVLAHRLDGIKSEAEVFALLRQMETNGLISWTLEACVGPYPEKSLRRQFERIGDPQLRAEAEGKLAQLETARTLVAAAAGNPQQLDTALSNLEETFTALTGAAATRAAGLTYAGRTLLYEDCRRDIEVEVGPAALEALGEPLSLLLESARWFTHVAAETYRRAFGEHYDILARKSGHAEVEFATFWSSIRSLILEPSECLVNDLVPLFQQRWSDLLDVSHDTERAHYRSADLRARVLEAFQAPPTPWSFSRYHNPDVMIVAADAAAVRRGDYLFVLGELHIGANTLGVSLFMEQHPAPEELYRAVEFDMPDPRLVPLVPKYWPHVTPRLLQVLITSRDYRLEMAPGPFDVPAARILKSGQLIVTRTGAGELVLRTRDGGLSFDIIESFATAIGGEIVNHFKLLPPKEHTPRISIDRLVVCRETWRFAASDVWFAFEKEAAERFAEARRWAGSHELPRFVFVKAAVEIKPFYLDLASPMYVELLGKVIRRCVERGLGEEAIVVTEMLPGPGESWLPDAAGERYASELRIVAVGLDGLTK
jgi:hypothetical protein